MRRIIPYLLIPFLSVCACSPGDKSRRFHPSRENSQVFSSLQGQLLRLNPVVPIESVQPTEVLQRLEKMRDWFRNNMSDSGEMSYQFMVGENKRTQFSNNLIRQMMTTLALFRLADDLKDQDLRAAAEKNLDFNLKHYMKIEEERKIAYIYGEKKAKLGAAAFALMTLLESRNYPDREKLIDYFKNFILSLQEKTGAFRTFYIPAQQNDNQNFYPGEALLALMTLYQSNPSQYQDLLPVVERAFQYYRSFFLSQPNPAFVPWHTMALYRFYQVKPQKEVAEFIFKMNDFLIEIQNTPESVKTAWPDAMGRYYDPTHREYGPPHASSTAVYTEGLVDAYRLAVQLGDKTREKSYAYAIRWGLRSLFQLQYTEETLALIRDKKAVLGGIHSTETNGDIRVDNVQHATMAFLNVLSLPDKGKAILVQVKE